MKNSYASIISKEKFEEIRPLLQRTPMHKAHTKTVSASWSGL